MIFSADESEDGSPTNHLWASIYFSCFSVFFFSGESSSRLEAA